VLIIRPGTLADVDAVQLLANESKTLPFLGGFTMREQLVGLYGKGNSSIPYNIVAELDGEIVGFSDSKAKGDHYHEYDLVAVKTDVRRERIASAMYAYHAYRCALSGRFFARDQTIHFNTVMQDGYLPFHGFKHIVGLRNKVRNFSTLNWWIYYFTPDTLGQMMSRAMKHEGIFFELEETEAMRKNFDRVYTQLKELGRVAHIEQIDENREYVR